MILKSTFDIRDRVVIDGDGSITGVVIAIRWTGENMPEYHIAWMHEGRSESAYFDEWRLT